MNGVGQTGFGTFAAIIGFIALVDPGVAYGQIEGALQYPPASIGDDAQPPPPARMVPKIVSPRRLELGASGSSLALTNPPYGISTKTEIGSLRSSLPSAAHRPCRSRPKEETIKVPRPAADGEFELSAALILPGGRKCPIGYRISTLRRIPRNN
jgi:hypothetical protein